MATVATGHRHRGEPDTATAGNDPSHQQGPRHMVAAGHEKGMANAGLLQLIHQGGEIGEGVVGAVIKLHLVGRQAFPLLEQPAGVLGIAAPGHHHRQAILLGQLSPPLLPGHIPPQHQDHLGRGGSRPPPAPGQPQQASGTGPECDPPQRAFAPSPAWGVAHPRWPAGGVATGSSHGPQASPTGEVG